ncbi:hypothetical protein [Nostoc sp. NMS4]|uniref:hypothetical protein n=1 Tax=Nostoc sp. NMS4 TaxID=2815390 RepID=UPI0025FDFAEC|nr:hypothetical protein [Nostoc sp. NMS4]MBN3923284.1 hypothetical protein [Nostoc sp. NMS4]
MMAFGELLRRKTDGASQFIGNSLQDFVVLRKSDIPSKGRSPGSQDPNLSLATLTYTAWFSLTALVVKTVAILPENTRDSSYIWNLFLLEF